MVLQIINNSTIMPNFFKVLRHIYKTAYANKNFHCGSFILHKDGQKFVSTQKIKINRKTITTLIKNIPSISFPPLKHFID